MKNRTCYYFDDIIKMEKFSFDNTFLDEKSYKTLIGAKPLLITFDKV